MSRRCEACGDALPDPSVDEATAGACWFNAASELRRLGRAGAVYVEGWAVRERNGQFEAFEHGWVELDGQPHDVTPHHHAVEYFGALKFADPDREQHEQGLGFPLYRSITSPCTPENKPNPHYEARAARDYAAAKLAADDFCRQNGR